jgi:hypothetical protein
LKRLFVTACVCGLLALCVRAQAQAQNPEQSHTATRGAGSDPSSAEAYGRALLERGPADEVVTWLKARILAKLIWNVSLDPWLPRAVEAAGHVAIDYGFGSTEIEDRVQDLLRRDESVRRSSSCVE